MRVSLFATDKKLFFLKTITYLCGVRKKVRHFTLTTEKTRKTKKEIDRIDKDFFIVHFRHQIIH